MMAESHILYAYEFDGQGGATKLEGDAIAQKIKDDSLAWVHFNVDHDDTREWLAKEASYLDPLILDALLEEETRPRITEYPEGFLIILRGVNLNDDAREEDMVSIRLWIDPHRIISTRRRKLRAVVHIRERLEAGKGPKNSADFLSTLVSRLIGNMEPVLIHLDDDTDQIEEDILGEPDMDHRKAINQIRKKAIILRRYIAPQKEAISYLMASDIPWITPQNMRQFRESHDKMTRYIEDLDAIRDRSQVIKDELANILSDRMNKNLYVLSLIAALFLPLGFLTGLLGINVGGMPGVESELAFWAVCALCIVVLGFEYVLFRWLRWL